MIAIVGGDEREQEIARLAAADGAKVRAHGFPWPERGIEGVTLSASPEEAMRNARYALLPIPRGVDGNLYAPEAPRPIPVRPELFAPLRAGAHVFCGRVTEALADAARGRPLTIHEYDPDRELMSLRASAVVEGVLQTTIAHTDITINAARVVVVGFGTIGSLLAPDLAMVFSTVPARVVDRPVVERLPRGSLVLDIVPPPHRSDLEQAERLGHRAVWARGLGRRAPVTVGASQWMGLRRRIEEIEAEEATG